MKGPVAVAVSSGVRELDARLGGGFFPGLWTIAGLSAEAMTAFLESVALEAATNQRPVVYHTLNASVETVRERLLKVIAGIAEEWAENAPDVRVESPSDLGPPAALGRALEVAVLSNLWIFDSMPLSPDPVGAFLRGLEHTLEHTTPQAGSRPVVLIDDRTTLLRALNIKSAQGALRTVAGLDGTLVRRGSPGLIAAHTDLSALLPPEEEAKTKGLVHLGRGHIEFVSRSATRADAIIRENAYSAWRGTVPLALHPSVGMFTSAV